MAAAEAAEEAEAAGRGWAGKGPLEWRAYSDREVRVSAGGRQFRGWVLTTDPVSATIVLVDFLDDGGLSVTGVMGRAVRSVETLREADAGTRERLRRLFAAGLREGLSAEQLERRKRGLRRWLERNHVPVSERGGPPATLCVAGALTVAPPYGPEDCSSANEIVLSRVQALIRGRPAASEDEQGPDAAS